MAITVDWVNKIINVPQSDLALVSAGVYSHDIDAFRLALKDLEDSEGMPFVDTHRHSTTVTVGGVTLARVVEIINGYTVTYENGTYAVVLTGANNNVADVATVNSVSIRPTNSAGLIQVDTGGGGFTSSDRATLTTAATNTATLTTRLSEARAAALDSLSNISERVLRLWQRNALDASNPVTRTKSGSDVTESFDDVTITHDSNGTDSVTSTRT